MVIRLVHNDRHEQPGCTHHMISTSREGEGGREGERERRGGHSLLPVWWQHSLGLVPPCQSVDPRLHQDQTELAVPILRGGRQGERHLSYRRSTLDVEAYFAVLLQVLADGHALLDHMVEILGNVGG